MSTESTRSCSKALAELNCGSPRLGVRGGDVVELREGTVGGDAVVAGVCPPLSPPHAERSDSRSAKVVATARDQGLEIDPAPSACAAGQTRNALGRGCGGRAACRASTSPVGEIAGAATARKRR